LLSTPPVSQAQKPDRKARRDAGNVFWVFSKFCQTFNTAHAQIWIFLKKMKCKGMLLSFSFDSLLSRGYKDDFTSFLAKSVQELWLFKNLPATMVAGAGV